MRRLLIILCTIGAAATWVYSTSSNPQSAADNRTSLVNYDIPLSKLLDSLNISETNLSIHIDKSEYQLTIKTPDVIVKEYPIVLGENPVDDKRMEGDRCTPEGTFHMRSKYPHKSWNKFIWIDYPTDDSWNKFKAAKAKGEIPADASIGGEIGIHGVPEGRDDLIDRGINWTWGCIALKRSDVDEIYDMVLPSTEIIITP